MHTYTQDDPLPSSVVFLQGCMANPVVMQDEQITIRHALDCPMIMAKNFTFRETCVLQFGYTALRDQWLRELKSEV